MPRTSRTNTARRAALYLRVSTAEQTIENQRQALTEAAARAGWDIVATYEDAGISGAKGRDKRPGLDGLMKDVTRRRVDIVLAWSVDRLGRSLQDLVGLLSDLHAVECDLYLHQQAVDTTTPAGRALFGMMGIFAEFERSMISERVHAGLARARSQGRAGGRPRTASDVEARVLAMRGEGMGIGKIARTLGIGTSVVQRISKASAVAILE